jgi:predicted nucleic acid-binding protein
MGKSGIIFIVWLYLFIFSKTCFNTSVLLSGIVWPRWPYEVLQHSLRGDFQLVLSQIIIREARRIFREKFPTYAQDFEDFLSECIYEEAPSPSADEVRANQDLMRDITDVPIALSAIKADIDYFVSDQTFLLKRKVPS